MGTGSQGHRGSNASTSDRGQWKTVYQSAGVWGKKDKAGQFLKIILNIITDDIHIHEDYYNLISVNFIHLHYYHIRSCKKRCKAKVIFLRTLRDTKPRALFIILQLQRNNALHTDRKQRIEVSIWQGEAEWRGILWLNSNHSSRYTVTSPLQIYNQSWKKIHNMKFNFQFQLLFL